MVNARRYLYQETSSHDLQSDKFDCQRVLPVLQHIPHRAARYVRQERLNPRIGPEQVPESVLLTKNDVLPNQ